MIGYARTSLFGDDAEQQRAELVALGVAPDRVYLDTGLVGMTRSRPALREALAALRRADTLVVTALFRLARSTTDAADLLGRLIATHAELVVGDVRHPPDGPTLRLLVDGLELAGELRSTGHSRRTRQGLRAARAGGQLKGRPPKMNPSQEQFVVESYLAGRFGGSALGRAVRCVALHRPPRSAPCRTRLCCDSGHEVVDRVPARRATRPLTPPAGCARAGHEPVPDRPPNLEDAQVEGLREQPHDRASGGGPGRPGCCVEQFSFDGGEERLGEGVVPALTGLPDRQPDAAVAAAAANSVEVYWQPRMLSCLSNDDSVDRFRSGCCGQGWSSPLRSSSTVSSSAQ